MKKKNKKIKKDLKQRVMEKITELKQQVPRHQAIIQRENQQLLAKLGAIEVLENLLKDEK